MVQTKEMIDMNGNAIPAAGLIFLNQSFQKRSIKASMTLISQLVNLLLIRIKRMQ